MITNITVKNIKGFDDSSRGNIDLELVPNKVNILIAPNGFGKSSLAAAISSLTKKGLRVDVENKFRKDESREPFLSMTLNGEILEDAKLSNEITCVVIKSHVEATSIQKNMGKFSSVTNHLDISDIVVKNTIPPKVEISYKFESKKKAFGVNGKILFNIKDLFGDPKFVKILDNYKDLFDKICSTRRRLALIENVVSKINTYKGTTEKIKTLIDESIFTEIKRDECYSQVALVLNENGFAKDALDEFIIIYQIIKIWGGEIKKYINCFMDRYNYEKEKRLFDDSLNLLSPEWKGIKTEEIKKSLVVRYPYANELSNGQRDVLTFVTELIKFRTKIKEGKKYFLLIDEVFDYLDDANTIVAQYYLTNFLNKDLSAEIYVCVLTHLDPKYFRSYIFSSKKINIQYLLKSLPISGNAMKMFIAHREGLSNKNVPNSLYNNLSKYLFHYNPQKVDYSSELTSSKSGFRKTFGKTEVLKNYLIEELNKYFSEREPYEPYAVAMALRHRVEKICYEKIESTLKNDFLEIHKTTDKLDFCLDHGFDVPDVFYIVSAIHNEADHLKFDPNNPNDFLEKSMVYKLQNNVIKQALKKLFEYKGEPISVDSIM